MNVYAIRYLVEHLYQSGNYPRLLNLVKTRLWFDKKLDFDPSRRSYADDVEQAIQAAEEIGIEGLSDFVVYNLIYSLLASITGNLDPEVLVLMTAVGNGLLAEDYVLLYTDPIKQVEAYSKLSKEYHRQGNTTKALTLLNKAIDNVNNLAIGSARDRALMLTATSFSHIGYWKKGKQLLNEIRDKEFRDRGAAELAVGVATNGQVHQGFTLAKQIESHHHAIGALAEIVYFAIDHQAEEIADNAYLVLQERFSEFNPQLNPIEARSRVFRSLLLIGDIDSAFQFADEYLDMIWIGHALRWLVRINRSELALEILEQLPLEAHERMDATDLAFILAANDRLEQALQAIKKVSTAKTKDGTYASLASWFARKGKLREALELTEQIKQVAVRTWALASIGQVLVRSGKQIRAEQILEQISQESTILNIQSMEVILPEIAHILAESGKGEDAIKLSHPHGLDQTVLIAAAARTQLELKNYQLAEFYTHKIADRTTRGELLCELIYQMCRAGMVNKAQQLIPAVPQQALSQTLIYFVRGLTINNNVEQALRFVAEIPSVAVRDAALGEIVYAELRRGYLESALSIFEQVQSIRKRSHLLSDIAIAAAKSGDLPTAFDLAARITIADYQANAYAGIAPHIYGEKTHDYLWTCLSACKGTRYYRSAIVNTVAAMIKASQSEEAISLVDMLPQEQREQAWIGIIRLLAVSDNLSLLKDQVLQVAQSYYKDINRTVVSGLIEGGRVERAKQLIPQINDPRKRFIAILHLAVHYTKMGRYQEGLELLTTITDPGAYSSILAKMSEQLAALGDFDHALLFSDQLYRAEERKQVWKKIAYYLATQNDLSRSVRLSSILSALKVARSKGQLDVWNCLVVFSPILVDLFSITKLGSLLKQLEEVQANLSSR